MQSLLTQLTDYGETADPYRQRAAHRAEVWALEAERLYTAAVDDLEVARTAAAISTAWGQVAVFYEMPEP
jgi:hypothetical protein